MSEGFEYLACAPTVTALVLTYNHARFISACLKGLAAANYSNLQVDLLDDGSSDYTLAVAQASGAATGLPIRVFTQPHSKGQTAKNSQSLIDGARGKYLLFMSGDDALAPDYPLGEMIDALEADSSLVLALPRALHFAQGDASRAISIYTPEFRELLRSGDPERVYREHLCKRVSRLFLQGAVLRADFVKESGGFDVNLSADDYSFMMRAFAAMRRMDKRFEFFEDSLWLYRIHADNIHADVARQQRVVMQVVSKYVPPEYWAQFRWDSPTPEDFASFQAWCGEITYHFGSTASGQIISGAARRFAYLALRRKDICSLRSLLAWQQTRWTAAAYVAPRMHRLLKF